MKAEVERRAREVRIVGVPMDLGADRRGVNMGPTAIRIAGLRRMLEELNHKVSDDGDVGVPGPESRDPGSPKAKYLREIYHVCNRLRMRIVRALDYLPNGYLVRARPGEGEALRLANELHELPTVIAAEPNWRRKTSRR